MFKKSILAVSGAFALVATSAFAGTISEEFSSGGDSNGGLFLLLVVGAVILLNSGRNNATRNDNSYETEDDQNDSIMKF